MPLPFEVISSVTQFAPRTPDEGPDRLIDAARQAERDGVDSLLVGYTSTTPDGWMMASYVLAGTTDIRVLLAHRPGVMSPNVAARMAATLDVLSRGRLSLNIVSGGSAIDQMREGDYVEHDDRYDRAIEYVGILKQLWQSTEPLDHDGQYYRMQQSLLRLKPHTKPHPPIYMGGASEAGKKFALASADAYMSWSEPVGLVKERFDELRERCLKEQRPIPRFSVSMRLIIGDTEEEAWARAESMLPADLEDRLKRDYHKEDVGRNRQLMLAKGGMVHDERLWMGLTAATGGQGSTGALVGTAEQVCDSLLRYVDEAGVASLLLTGADGAYEPMPEGFVADLRSRANEILSTGAHA